MKTKKRVRKISPQKSNFHQATLVFGCPIAQKKRKFKISIFSKVTARQSFTNVSKVPKMEVGQFSTNMVERPLVLKPSTRKNFW